MFIRRVPREFHGEFNDMYDEFVKIPKYGIPSAYADVACYQREPRATFIDTTHIMSA